MTPKLLFTSLRFAYDSRYRNNAIDKLCEALEVDKTGPEMCSVSDIVFKGFNKISVKANIDDINNWSASDIKWFVQQVDSNLPKSSLRYVVLDEIMNKLAVKVMTDKKEPLLGYPKWFIASYINPIVLLTQAGH